MNENMKELQLRSIFTSFLTKEKGFPSDSLLFEFPIEDRNENRRNRADLILHNPDLRDYLGLVEFKKYCNESTLNSAFFQVRKYIDLLGQPDLPVYLVCFGEDKFSIYTLDSDDKWIELDKSEFPSYNALSSIRYAKQKNEHKTEKYKIEVKEQKERTITRVTTYISMISVAIALILFFFSTKLTDLKKEKEATYQTSMINNIVDSLQSQIQRNKNVILTLSDSIAHFKIYADSLSNSLLKIDDNSKIRLSLEKKIYNVQNEISRTNIKLNDIESKLTNIEGIIMDNPEKVLTIPLLKKDLETQRHQIDAELELVNNDFEWMKEKLNSYGNAGITFFISILVALTSLIVGNFLKTEKKK